MRRVAEGDRVSFHRVYAVLREHLSRWCATLCASEADDIVQKSLMTIFARASSFRADGDVIAWAFAIAGWEARSLRRKEARQTSMDELRAQTSDANPEEQAIEANLRATLAQTVATLSDADRRVIAQLAQARGPRGTTTRKRLSRALARLRGAWRRLHDQ
jgi:RNA polymerase sigma-70 factor (ECF subfamily)